MLKTLVKTTRTTTRIYVSAHRNQEGSFLFLGIAWLKTLTASTNKKHQTQGSCQSKTF